MLLVVVSTTAAYAQWKNVSFVAGMGVGYADDDLFDNSPVLSWQAGISADRYFRQRSYAAQHLFFRTGIGIASTGSRFRMVSDYGCGERKGKYDVVSIKVPLRIGWCANMDNMKNQKKVLVWVGPSLMIGVGGRMSDSLHLGRYEGVDYNSDYSWSEIRKRGCLRTIDVSMDIGVELVCGRFVVGLEWGMGLVPLRPRSDALQFIDVEPDEPVSGHFARSRTLLINIGCQMPVKHKPKPSRSNAIFM